MQRGDLLDNAKCGQIEVTVAIPPGGGTQRLPRVIGKVQGYGVVLTGRIIDAPKPSVRVLSPATYLSPS
jgi:enoyl-CoA hydratase/carnithine racemase